MNLESTFSSSEIKKTLGGASQQFEQVDKYFKNLMSKVEKSPSAAKLIKSNANLVKQLEGMNEIVEEIQRELAKYLETKRVSFPRFFFLSDEELLDILANSENKEVIQGFLKALFDGLVKLKIDEFDGADGMISKEGEVVPFAKIVKSMKEIETWLNKIQEEMKATVLKNLRVGLKELQEGKIERKAWVLRHPG